MKATAIAIGLSLMVTTFSCKPKSNTETATDSTTINFDLANSEPAAVQLADSMIAAAGGTEAWSKTRFISWTFREWNFSWDKVSNRGRAETLSKSSTFLLDLNTNTGKARENGIELEGELLQERLNLIREMFLNTREILVLPFSLKEGSAKLTYLGEELTEETREKCNVLSVTFGTVDALAHRCKLLVALKDNVIQECVCTYANDSTMMLTSRSYKQYGNLLLSEAYFKTIKIDDNLPEKFFSEL